MGGAVGNPDSPTCSAVTIEEARVLAEIWAGLEGDETSTWVYPILPHGPGFDSGA